MNKDIFCPAPWLSLVLEPNGHIFPCCAFPKPLGHYRDSSSLDEVKNSSEMAALRNSFLNDQIPNDCMGCFNKEKAGVKSRRIKYLRKYHKLLPSIMSGDTTTKVFELSFSNSCNLACTMCGPRWSSSWFKHEHMMRDAGLREGDFYNPMYEQAFSVSNEDVLKLVDFCKPVDHLVIYGGEPLYDKRCQLFLEQFAEIQRDDQQLTIITNASHLLPNVLISLSKIKNLTLAISIDGTNEIYQLVRGFSFERFNLNTLELLKLPATTYHINITTSILNAHNVLDTLIHADKYYSDPRVVFGVSQIVSHPEYMNPNTLPLDIRQNILTNLNSWAPNTLNVSDLDSYKNVLGRDIEVSDKLFNQQKKFIQVVGKMRNKNVIDIVPHLKYLE